MPKPWNLREKRLQAGTIREIMEKMNEKRRNCRQKITRPMEKIRQMKFTPILRLIIKKYSEQAGLKKHESYAIRAMLIPKTIKIEETSQFIPCFDAVLELLLLEKQSGKERAKKVLADWCNEFNEIKKSLKEWSELEKDSVTQINYACLRAIKNPQEMAELVLGQETAQSTVLNMLELNPRISQRTKTKIAKIFEAVQLKTMELFKELYLQPPQ